MSFNLPLVELILCFSYLFLHPKPYMSVFVNYYHSFVMCCSLFSYFYLFYPELMSRSVIVVCFHLNVTCHCLLFD